MSSEDQEQAINDAPTASVSADAAAEHLRMVEALLFAAGEALSVEEIAERLPDGADVAGHIETIRGFYAGRGVNLAHLAGKWLFRTAPDLSFLLREEVEEQRKLSRAGVETLAIIAYHQPVTRAEIEEIRGVGISKGTLDVLMEAGWIKLKGRRRTPGRPVTYGTSEEFLVHFGLESLDVLPGLDELKAAGLLDSVDKALSKMEEEMSRQREAEAAQMDIEEAIEDAANADGQVKIEAADHDDDVLPEVVEGQAAQDEDIDGVEETWEDDVIESRNLEEILEDDDEDDEIGEDEDSLEHRRAKAIPTLELVKDSLTSMVDDDEGERS